MDEGCGIVIIIVAVVFLAGTLFGLNLAKPSAMDVYQGKTTLEITYKSGVAIDSTVVYKNK